MKERPIIFSDAMVRAILEGRKTQTRRIIKPQPAHYSVFEHFSTLGDYVFSDRSYVCPYGQPGDRLWVRETWQPNTMPTGWPYYYRATDEEVVSGPWKSPIFMPRDASRILLEITDVRVERVQEITEVDAVKEGCTVVEHEQPYLSANGLHEPGVYGPPSDMFFFLWQSIYGPASWEQNPWVWVIEFKKIDL